MTPQEGNHFPYRSVITNDLGTRNNAVSRVAVPEVTKATSACCNKR